MNEDNKNRWKIIKPVIPPEEIIEDLKKKVEEEPQNSNCLRQLAILLYKQKRYEESFSYLEKLLASGVRDPDILSSYGDVLLERGRHREAKVYFKEALSQNKNDTIAQSGMVKIEEIEKQLAKTRKRITKYASIASAVFISLMTVSIVFTKNPFSFMIPNKLYRGVVVYYVGKTSGTLKIETNPAGANVSVDGKSETSTTPAEITLKKGQHTVNISKDGYKDYSTTADIEVGKTKSISTTLKKKILGTLKVVTSPEGENVYIDGAYKGVTPFSITLETGAHNIKITKEGYYDYINTVQIHQSKTTNLSTTLQLNPVLKFKVGNHVQAIDYLNVRSSPSLKGSVIKVVPKGSVGIVKSSSQSADGYHWWTVEWSSGVTGWSAGEYMKIYTGNLP